MDSLGDELGAVVGFSGPWESNTEDFSDTSFMIAIDVLKDAQRRFSEKGQKKTIKCFFVAKDPAAYAQLKPAIMNHHDPDSGFIVEAYGVPFEDAVPQIFSFLDHQTFALVFIDPTGWTGYPYDKIEPLLRRAHSEVLINMMYDFINRFTGDGRSGGRADV